MIKRDEPSFNTVEKMFDLIWDNLFYHINLETNIKLFKGLERTYSYVNKESKVILELTDIVTKYKVTDSFFDCVDFIDLFDRVNYAQIFDWKVYIINSHLINKEDFLNYIVNDIDRRKYKLNYQKSSKT